MKWKEFSRLSEQPTTVVPETRHRGQLRGDKGKRAGCGGVGETESIGSEVKNGEKKKKSVKSGRAKILLPLSSHLKSSDLCRPGSCDVIELQSSRPCVTGKTIEARRQKKKKKRTERGKERVG